MDYTRALDQAEREMEVRCLPPISKTIRETTRGDSGKDDKYEYRRKK